MRARHLNLPPGGGPRPKLLDRRPCSPRVAFETLPVLHVQRARFPEYPDAEPEDVLKTLARAHQRVALIDVAGIRANEADLEFVQAASRRRSIWVDAGSRFATDAMDVLVAGAETLTMRWNTLDSAAELEEAVEDCEPGSLFLGLEVPRSGFLRHPKDARALTEVASFAAALGAGLVFIVAPGTDLATLPQANTPRFVQGLPRAEALAAEEHGFAGALLAPTQLEAAP